MKIFLLLIALLIFWFVGDQLVYKLTGFKRPSGGIQRWTYDLPAYLTGFAAGYFLF